MTLYEIQYAISSGGINAAKVFTLMKQHIDAESRRSHNEVVELIEKAHMAGQFYAGVDPSYSAARAHWLAIIKEAEK